MKKSVIKFAGLTVLAIALTATSCKDNEVRPIDNTEQLVIDRKNVRGSIKQGETVILDQGTYKLTGPLIVESGGKLIIKSGVVIEATKFSDGEEIRYIATAQGGQIFVEGTKEKPVVMTASVKQQSSWGGLVICGRAPINKGMTASAEVSGLSYGGNVVDDSSGSIQYLRIEYSGYAYSSEKEFNGLSMFGVGNGTKIAYVQVHEGSDDGFEWFGGTVNTSYLVATANEDDQFDWTEGWNGSNEYWFAKETSTKGNRGIEGDNNSNNHWAEAISNPNIKYFTLIGRNEGSENQAMKLRVGTKGSFDNVVLSNWAVGFDIESDASIAYVGDNTLKATNVKFENIGTKAKGKKNDGTAANVDVVYTENTAATGAGAGTSTPEWAKGWTVGL